MKLDNKIYLQKAHLLCACAAVLVLGAPPAQAGFNGQTIQMTEYEAATPPGPPTGSFEDFGNQVVGPGLEPYIETGWSVDISDTEILLTDHAFTFAFATSFPYFGDTFFDVFSTVDTITGVTLLGTSIPGMTASNVTFDADHVYLNFANLPITTNGAGDFVHVGVQFVPEPASASLAAFGAIAVAGLARKRSLRRQGLAIDKPANS